MTKNLSFVGLVFFASVFHSVDANALDTTNEEGQCVDIGFKKKTPAFANCVLELVDRKSAKSGSADPDDATCRKYGFKPRTESYAACRQQIDLAKQQAQQRQAAYEQQRAEYEAEFARQKKDQELALAIQMLSGMSSRKSSISPLIAPPAQPSNLIQSYTLPGGKMMNCNTVGSFTSCY